MSTGLKAQPIETLIERFYGKLDRWHNGLNGMWSTPSRDYRIRVCNFVVVGMDRGEDGGQMTNSQALKLGIKYHQLHEWQHPGARCRDILHGEEWMIASYPWVEAAPGVPMRILVQIRQPGRTITVDALGLEPTNSTTRIYFGDGD